MQDNTSFILFQGGKKTFRMQIVNWVLAHLASLPCPPPAPGALPPFWKNPTGCSDLLNSSKVEFWLKWSPNKKAMVPKYFSLPSLISLLSTDSLPWTCTHAGLVELIPQRLRLQKPNTTTLLTTMYEVQWQNVNASYYSQWPITKSKRSNSSFGPPSSHLHIFGGSFFYINKLLNSMKKTTGCRNMIMAPKETKYWMKTGPFSAWQNSVWMTNALFALCPATCWWCHVFLLPRWGSAHCLHMLGGGVQWTALAFAHLFIVERCLL